MLISTDKLIADYYQKIKDDYPDLTLSELVIICNAPFAFLRDMMKKVTLPTVRFKYFGSFIVYRKRIENAGKVAQRIMQWEGMSEEKFKKIQNLVEENEKVD